MHIVRSIVHPGKQKMKAKLSFVLIQNVTPIGSLDGAQIGIDNLRLTGITYSP
jgi:hypothetical protein